MSLSAFFYLTLASRSLTASHSHTICRHLSTPCPGRVARSAVHEESLKDLERMERDMRDRLLGLETDSEAEDEDHADNDEGDPDKASSDV